jgi:hypothetical protein
MVVGKMKDEAGGLIITEFVGLRPKMYSYITMQENKTTFKESKRAKGIQRAAMTDIRHADYLAQLNAARENYVNIRRIGQKHHRVFTIEGVKRGLCSFDDKRYLRPDGINTYAHGHHRVRDQQTAQVTDEELELISHHSTLPNSADDDTDNVLALSYADAQHMGVRQRITEDEALAIVSGLDLPRAVQHANTVPCPAANGADDDDDDDSDNEDVFPHLDRAARSVVQLANSFAVNDMF